MQTNNNLIRSRREFVCAVLLTSLVANVRGFSSVMRSPSVRWNEPSARQRSCRFHACVAVMLPDV